MKENEHLHKSAAAIVIISMIDNPRIEYQLVQDGTLFDEIEIIETKIVPTVGNEDWAVTIEFCVEEDLVESCAFGLIYVLGLLSFHDGRPRGVSGKWFEDDDEFTAADMLRHLKFERGTLKMYVDYLRGRCIKTDLEVSSNGRVFLKTVNRGQAATRWIDRLKGKTFLRSVGHEDAKEVRRQVAHHHDRALGRGRPRPRRTSAHHFRR